MNVASHNRVATQQEAVYYLIHGMGRDDFAESDRTVAAHFVEAVRAHGVGRVVYLS